MRGELRFEKQISTTGRYGGVLELHCTISGSNISFYFSANYSFPAENGGKVRAKVNDTLLYCFSGSSVFK